MAVALPDQLSTLRLPAALQPLLGEQRFVVWRWEVRDGKRTKVPYSPHRPRARASTKDATTWGSFSAAAASAPPRDQGGIGLVLTDHPTLCAFDLDDCRDPTTGQLAPWANHLVDAAGSYTEVTPSGTGLRIIGTVSEGVPAEHSKRPTESGGSIEVYRRATRYITLSFDPVPGTLDRLGDVGALVDVVQTLYGRGSKPRPATAIDMAATSFEDIEGAVHALPDALRECIESGSHQQPSRSEAFKWAVCELAERGWLAGDIVAALDANPAGIAEKYDGRLGAEVARVLSKWGTRPNAADEFDTVVPLVGAETWNWPDIKANRAALYELSAEDPERHRALVGAWALRNDIDPVQLRQLVANDAGTAPARQKAERLHLVWASDIPDDFQADDFVEGLLSDGQASVVYGESNTGKTFFVSDLALHIALGWKWRGLDVDQGAVVYVAAEGGLGIRRRIAAFRKVYGLEGINIPFAIVPCSINLRASQSDLDGLIRLILEAAAKTGMRVRLVVIDTLARALAGGNENASEDMGAYVQAVDHIRERTGAHTLTIHHSGKDGSKGARGHSSLRGAVDTEIEISRDAASKAARATVTKQRDLDASGVFPFRLETVALGTDRRGKPLTSCVVRPADDEAAARKPLPGIYGAALEKLKSLIAAHGGTAPEGVPAGDRDVVTLDAWRDFLRDKGVLDGSDPNHRKSWQRIREKLIASKHIEVWQSHVWLP